MAPPSGGFEIAILPSCSVTIFRQIARPRPLPRLVADVGFKRLFQDVRREARSVVAEFQFMTQVPFLLSTTLLIRC